MLSVLSLFTSNHNNFDNDVDLETSATNSLFNGKSYPFELKDVYDDENYTKIYTDAYLQTEYNQNGTVFDDQVSVVNNTNYKSPSVDGHYPATNSFSNEPDGTSGNNIKDFSSYATTDSNALVSIVGEEDGHNKVVKLEADGDNGASTSIYHSNGGSSYNSITFTIELWVKIIDNGRGRISFRLYSGAWNDMVYIWFDTNINVFKYGEGDGGGGTTWHSVATSVDTWNHIKIETDTTTDTWSVWLNGTNLMTDGNFRDDRVCDTIAWGRFLLYDAAGLNALEAYVDAIDISIDPSYEEGRNLYSEPVSMINGTFDNSDNMKANDDTYSNFTSTEAVPVPEEFINDIAPSKGSYYDGLISDTWVDNGVAYRIQSEYGSGAYIVSIDINFDPVEGGRNFYVSAHIGTSGTWGRLSMNGVQWKYSTNIDFDDEVYNGLTSVQYSSGKPTNLWASVYYFKLVEIEDPVLAELNYTVDLNFEELDTSKLLALDVSSYHYTNISTTIVGNIYDYNSGTYTQMFSSSNTAETENYFTDNTSISDYLDGSGNLRLYFTGTNSDDFKQIIDYIKVRFYYKMDITIDKTFYINGIWRYRFKLIGSLHYTDWTVFEVIDPIPNFYAISESELTTRWVLQNATIIPTEDFHDDINTDYWNFISSSSIIFNYTENVIGDSRLNMLYPDDNYGNSFTTRIRSNSGSLRLRGAVIFPDLTSDYLFSNQSGDNNFYFKFEYNENPSNTLLKIYNTSSFTEYGITWNNQPTLEALQDSQDFQGLGWRSFQITDMNGYYIMKYDPENLAYPGAESYIYTIDYANYYGINRPYLIRENINKNYFGSGYMYMQTDITESISLKSKDYGTHKTLSSGDYFEVDFQTNSDSQINLILLKDGSVNKALTLSPSGNTNFGRHTAKISVDELVEFDQLKISSTFEDKDNVKVYDIKTYKYTLTGDHADFYVGSKRDREVYLTPDIYNLRILEEGDEKVNVNVTIPATGVLDYIYTPIERLECRLTLFNTEGSHLEFIDYHVKVNRSLNDVYNEFWLLDSIFSADKNTYAYISVYDRFDTLIDTFERLASEYIDVEIEVYSLQIKNLMTQKTTLDINGTHVYPLLSGDSIYFMLSRAYYQIGYYDTNDVYKQFTIYLDSNQAYELNRSRICFLSYADQQGNHLSFENYKTYLNGSLIYENIFYREIGDNVGIEIKDRYDISIKNETYTVISGDNYIPITLTMYSLKIMNQQEIFNWINITKTAVRAIMPIL
jgi:hypothetical protein